MVLISKSQLPKRRSDKRKKAARKTRFTECKHNKAHAQERSLIQLCLLNLLYNANASMFFGDNHPRAHPLKIQPAD
jgi:hypothetical protein